MCEHGTCDNCDRGRLLSQVVRTLGDCYEDGFDGDMAALEVYQRTGAPLGMCFEVGDHMLETVFKVPLRPPVN